MTWKCPECKYPNPDDRGDCFKCGTSKPAPPPPLLPDPVLSQFTRAEIEPPPPSLGASLRISGGLLIVIGIAIVLYFVAIYDTSVSTSSSSIAGVDLPDRVNNLGLLNSQHNGVLSGWFLALFGCLCNLTGCVIDALERVRYEVRGPAAARKHPEAAASGKR